MPLHVEDDGMVENWPGNPLVGRRELQSPPGIMTMNPSLQNFSSMSAGPGNQEDTSPSNATIISLDNPGGVGAPPPPSSSSTSSPLSTINANRPRPRPLNGDPAPLPSSEIDLMTMNDPLLSSSHSNFQSASRTQVSLVDISSVNAADAVASRLAFDANPNLLDSAKKPMSQLTDRLRVGSEKAMMLPGFIGMGTDWEMGSGALAGVYGDLNDEADEMDAGDGDSTGRESRSDEPQPIHSPNSSRLPSPSSSPLPLSPYSSLPTSPAAAPVVAPAPPAQVTATKRPAARKKTVPGGRKKRTKNKPFDSPDFVTITNVDIYVGTVKADSPEHALQLVNRGEESWCKCRKSRCLKLYCDCFQAGNNCKASCGCAECLNTVEHSGKDGIRTHAVIAALLRRPDAFEKRVREFGNGCGCKNSGCLKKYCECFREGQPCNPDVCKCQGCKNLEGVAASMGKKPRGGGSSKRAAVKTKIRPPGIITPADVNRAQAERDEAGKSRPNLLTPTGSITNSPTGKPAKMSRLSPEGGGRAGKMVVTPPLGRKAAAAGLGK